MKELFKGFYTPSDTEIRQSWANKKTLFVFDTNVLLNLYQYTESTRDDFFQIIDHISDKVWLPYHVALEYQRNRLTVIKNEKAVFTNLHSYIKNLEKNIETNNLQELKLSQRLPELEKKTKKMQENIVKLLEKYKQEIDEWNNKQPDVRSSDKVRKRIDAIFNKKIGSIPESQKWLDYIYKEGEKRYKLGFPPGYMYKKEKEQKENFLYADLEYVPMYGDLIIWKQILEKAEDKNIDSLIFITDDVKEDWWYILNSNGKKEIGARAELRDEIYRNSKISSFEILRTTDFMKNGKEILELAVKETSINEAKTNFENKRNLYKIKVDSDLLKKLAELNSTSLSDLLDDRLKSINENKLEYLINEKLKTKNISSQNFLDEALKHYKVLQKENELTSHNKLLEKLKAFDYEKDIGDTYNLESYIGKRKDFLEKLKKLDEDDEI